MHKFRIAFVMQFVDYYPPLGLMAVSSMARKHGHDCRVVVIDKGNALQAILDWRPDLVCYGGGTGEHKFYTAFNHKLQSAYAVPTVVGGPHATYFPEILQHGRYDWCVRGEGELPFESLIEDLRGTAKGMLPVGIAEDLDSLPFPDRQLFYDEPATRETGLSGTKHFMATRGCPYPCTYCYAHTMRALYPGRKYVRRKSVDYIIEEVLAVKKRYPLNAIKFYDDVFTHRCDAWLERFAVEYPRRVGIPFFTLTRYDLLTEDMARCLSEAGCRTLQMSIESANPRIRREVLRRDMSDDMILEAHEVCRKHGIRVIPNFMIGLPTSRHGDDVAAVTFACRNSLEYTDYPIYQPYPKTKLGDMCIRRGWFDGDYEKIHLSYGHHTVLTCFPWWRRLALRNLTVLGTVASLYPRWRWLILYVCVFLPMHPVWYAAYYVVKMRYHMTKVYSYHHSPREILRLLAKSLYVEYVKKRNRFK